jgi:predicted DNA-binding transcriptional regulator AlpA
MSIHMQAGRALGTHNLRMNDSSRTLITTLLSLDPDFLPAERAALESLLISHESVPAPKFPAKQALLLSQREAAELLGVERTTVWRMCSLGILRPVELSPGTFRYAREQVERLAREGYRHQIKALRKEAA